jgi:hypothetical protein
VTVSIGRFDCIPVLSIGLNRAKLVSVAAISLSLSFLPDERNDENPPGRRDTAGQLLSSSLCRRPPRRVAQLLSTLLTVVVCGGELVFALSLLHSISLSPSIAGYPVNYP